MKAMLLEVHELFGISIEVYFILLFISIPTFFFWRWLFKKYIKVKRTRLSLTWLTTVLFTPCIYLGLVLLWMFIISYYPNRDFNKQEWLNGKDERYELSSSLIESQMLIGKSKMEVKNVLGNNINNDSLNIWTYYLGIKPGINVDESILKVKFSGNEVIKVVQY